MPEVNDINERFTIARRKLVLFYLIDTSSSMAGTRIGVVNNTMKELESEFKDLVGPDAEICVAVLTFDNKAVWMYDSPIPIEDFNWKKLEANGMTCFGEALTKLDEKLSRNAFLASPSLSLAPVIFLMSDGAPNDDWETPLATIKKNTWFQHSLKFAVAIGDGAYLDVLEKFTDDPELVVLTTNGKELKDRIKFLTVTSSMIGSKSHGTSAKSNTDMLKNDLENHVNDIEQNGYGDDDEEDIQDF